MITCLSRDIKVVYIPNFHDKQLYFSPTLGFGVMVTEEINDIPIRFDPEKGFDPFSFPDITEGFTDSYHFKVFVGSLRTLGNQYKREIDKTLGLRQNTEEPETNPEYGFGRRNRPGKRRLMR